MPVRTVDDKPSDTLVVVSGEGFWTGSSTLPHLHQWFCARRAVPPFRASPPAHLADAAALPPAELRRDVLQDALHGVGVVLHAELVWDREQQRVGRLDRRVLGELLDEDVGLRSVGPAEDRLRLRVDPADLVRVL